MRQAHLFFLPLLLLTLAAPMHAATLLVANKSEASVSLHQLPGGEIVATLPTGEGPHEVAVSPDGKRALVSNYGTRGQPGQSLTLVDIAQARVAATIPLPDGAMPHGIEWLDDRHTVVTAEGIASLLLVDTETRQVSGRIAIDQDIAHMVTTGAGRAFTANIGSGTATAVDLEGASKITDLASGKGTEGIALARGGSQLWLSNRGADTVSVFDAVSLERLAQFPLAGFPIRIEADDPRGVIYVTLPSADSLAVIDTGSREVRRKIKFDIGPDRTRKTLFGDMLPDSSIPIGVLLSRDGESLFVAHSNAHVVSVYDPDTMERKAIIPTGLEPDGMDWSPVEADATGR